MNLKRLDTIFSTYIRLRDSDENGICRCITCGTPHHWKKLDNGHHIKRQHLSVRYNEINCNAQCRKCNWLGQGEDAKYKEALIKKHGQQVYDQLQAAKNAKTKWTQFEIDTLTEFYKQQIKNLKK